MNDPIPPIGGKPTPPKNSGLAVWSLVLGILSLFCFSIFAAIPGVICGHKALTRIKRSGGALEGQGLALAGLVTSYLSLALVALVMIYLMTAILPNFIKARETTQKNTCINNLRQLDGAKEEWALEKNITAGGTPTEQDLAPYLKQGMPKCPANGEYKLNPLGEPPTCSIPSHRLEQNSGDGRKSE